MIFPKITLFLFAVLGCARHSEGGLISSMPSGAGQAVIGRKEARFVFPREVDSLFRWDLPEPQLAPTVPEFNWTVWWEAPGAPGTAPIALTLITYWREGGPREGTLRQMLEPWRPSVEVECGDCQETTWLGQHDPAVVKDVVDGRVVVRVHGEAAVSRIFPTVPDSVTMSRSRPGTYDDQTLSLAVEHREP